MKFTKEWTKLTHEMGYWVDTEHPYVTYENKYIETLWWLLKQLFDKGLLYKGYTIQPYSPAAGTGLSSHEMNQPGCYRDVKDTTVTSQFKLTGEDIPASVPDVLKKAIAEGTAYALAWTTTPWTLTSNTALCVGPKIKYSIVSSENPYNKVPAVYVLASDLVSAHFGDGQKLPAYTLLGECTGADLVGLRYEQLIPFFKVDGDAFRLHGGLLLLLPLVRLHIGQNEDCGLRVRRVVERLAGGLDGLQLFFAFLTLAVFGVPSVFLRSQIFNFVLDSLDSRNRFDPVFFEITNSRIIEHERRAVFFVKLFLLFLRQL
jgi:hypothetical protein